MSERELGASEPDGTGVICPECDERFKNAISLGVHRSREHGVLGRNAQASQGKAPRSSRSTGGAKGAELNRLRRELKKDVNALCLLPFIAKGTSQNLIVPGVTDLIDEKAESFADAWVACAEQNDWVRVNLSRALAGGVWLNAAAQTAALGYVVGVFSGFVPLHPGAVMFMPEMARFVPQTQQQPAGENGGQPPVQPRERDDDQVT